LKTISKVIFGVGIVGIGLFLGAFLYGVRLNITSSLPYGLYLYTPIHSPTDLKRGDIVLACPEPNAMQYEAKKRGYLRWGFACEGYFAPLLKKVMAFPKDKVEVSTEEIIVNGKDIPNTRHFMTDGQGRSLPIALPEIVAGGKVWLLSDYNPKSYDSRYFGAIPISTVYGIAKPLWVSE
jgi:conjugative transfer signal peptidase TraF